MEHARPPGELVLEGGPESTETTSQDGGDSTSITSGFENEMKKPIIGLIKTKKTSLKRKVQNLSHESDEAVIEPLLQKDKDKTQMSNQSAKHLLSKAKTESLSEVINDKDKLLPDKKNEKSLTTAPSAVTGASSFINGTKENHILKSHENSAVTLHNYMNTNIFSSLDGGKSIVLPKAQILVEIDSGKQSSYNPSPLIFTTAKIHTDGKTKHMEPVQVTPVPILSTVEGSVIKSGNIGDSNKFLSGVSNKGDVLNTIYATPSTIDSKVVNEQQCAKITPSYSNLPYSGMTSRLLNENKEQNALSQQSVCSNKSNNVLKSVITVDVNITLPAKAIKSETGVTGNSLTKIDKSDIDKNDRASKSAIIKDTFMSNGNRIDVNKNIQPLSTSSIDKVSSDKVATGNKTVTDMSGIKQLQRQKQAIAEDNDKDMIDPCFNSDKLYKDTIDKSYEKLQQDSGASKAVVDVNKPLSKFSTNLTATTNVTSKSVIESSADKTSPLITETLAYTKKTVTIPSVSASSSGKIIKETVKPTTKTTSTPASSSLINKPVSTIVPSSAKITIPASTSIGKSISTKTTTVTTKPQTVAVSTSIPKKLSQQNVSNNPLSTTSVTLKSPVTVSATSTVKPTESTNSTSIAEPKTSLISTAIPIVSTTTVTSTTKSVAMTTSSTVEPSATKSGSTKAKPTVSSSESTVKSTVKKTTSSTTNTLSSTSKPITTVKSQFTASNTTTSKTPISSADKVSIATTLSVSYPTGTPPVTKSANITSITDLGMKSENSKSLNAAQSTAKTVTDVASSTIKPVTTSSSIGTCIPIAKKQENSNQSTSLQSSKIPATTTTASPMHSTSVASSKSPVASTTFTFSNSVKNPSGKS